MVGVDPVDDRLVVDREDAADPSEVRAFEVEAHGLTLSLLGVSEGLRLRGIDALTFLAPVALAAGARVAGFSLPLRRGAMRALIHARSLPPAATI